MNNISKRFIKGLEEYNLTLEEIQSGSWKYSGGDTGSHLNNFILINKKKPDFGKKYNCICGHHIDENCYITNGTDFLTLGNCCIKRFLPKDKTCKTCEKCGIPHKNRKNNLCNDCKRKYCIICDNEKDYIKYKKCYDCYINNRS